MTKKPKLTLITEKLIKKIERKPINYKINSDRYKKEIYSVYNNKDYRLGFMMRRINITGPGTNEFTWCVSKSITHPVWEGLFNTRKEARMFLEQNNN